MRVDKRLVREAGARSLRQAVAVLLAPHASLFPHLDHIIASLKVPSPNGRGRRASSERPPQACVRMWSIDEFHGVEAAAANVFATIALALSATGAEEKVRAHAVGDRDCVP